MISIYSEIERTKKEGYKEEYATAKVCQDIILNAISRSRFSGNITVKGGVVMRCISQNARRGTQDIDIDFIRYSLADDSVRRFIENLNTIDGLKIELYGNLEELRQQDYHGKRAYVKITDSFNFEATSKVDFGVHRHLNIKQEEFCFDIALQDDGVSLLINSKEQMFTEKLRSLLKFGTRSTRYKDIFDLYWLSGRINKKDLLHCFDVLIFSDSGMKETNISDIQRRIEKTLSNEDFRRNLSASKKNWLDQEDDEACKGLMEFISSL